VPALDCLRVLLSRLPPLLDNPFHNPVLNLQPERRHCCLGWEGEDVGRLQGGVIGVEEGLVQGYVAGEP
jgi:hypothetical protein